MMHKDFNRQLLRRSALALCLSALSHGTLADDYQDAWQKAQRLLQKNDAPAAIIELRNALQEKPDSIEARLLLADLYFQDGNLPAAEKEYDKARELKAPKNRWQKPLGRTWLSMYQSAKVLSHITEASSDPAALRAEALALRGLAILQQAKIDDAEQVLLQATSLQPDQVEAVYGLAQIARLRSDFGKAETLARQAIKKDPTFTNSHLLLTELLVMKNQRDEAIKTINAAVDQAPNDARIRLARGEALISIGQVKDAWNDINLVLTATPKHPVALFLKAKAHMMEQKQDDALATLDQALAVMPTYTEAQLLSGFIHVQKRQWRQAEEMLSRTLASKPDHLGATKLLIQTKLGLRLGRDALKLATDALRKYPEDIQLMSYQATAHIQLQEFDKASEIMERAVEISPDADNLRTGLALLQLQEGQTAAALGQLESASKDNTELQISDLMLISTYMSQKQTDKAVQLAEQLYKKHSNNALAANMLGVIKLSTGDYPRAAQLFEQAVKLRPEFLTARLNQARVDVAKRDFDAALKKLHALNKESPTLNIVALQLAQVYDAKGDRAQGLEWLKKAWQLDNRSLATGNTYLRRLLQMNKPMDALVVAQQMIAANPDAGDAHLAQGLAQRANKNYSSAIASLRKAVQLNHRNPDYYFALADVLEESGDHKGAADAMKDLLKQRPNSWQAHLALGRMDLRSKNYAAAHQRAAELIKQFPALPIGQQLEADTLAAEGKYVDAAKAYEKAYKQQPSFALANSHGIALQRANKPGYDGLLSEWLKQNPDDNAARFALATLYQQNSRNDRALEQYKLLEKKAPNDAVLLNNMTWLYAETSDIANTKTYLAKLEALKLNQANIIDTQGYAYLKLGDAKKALEQFNAALKIAPDNVEIRYHAALAHERLGNASEAKKQLKQVLDSKQSFAQRDAAEALYKKL
ncbi:MAG: XrtA/PEP-CTERM system TPR-repeat protein PrsT [Pseudomonadota bacterium]